MTEYIRADVKLVEKDKDPHKKLYKSEGLNDFWKGKRIGKNKAIDQCQAIIDKEPRVRVLSRGEIIKVIRETHTEAMLDGDYERVIADAILKAMETTTNATVRLKEELLCLHIQRFIN